MALKGDCKYPSIRRGEVPRPAGDVLDMTEPKFKCDGNGGEQMSQGGNEGQEKVFYSTVLYCKTHIFIFYNLERMSREQEWSVSKRFHVRDIPANSLYRH